MPKQHDLQIVDNSGNDVCLLDNNGINIVSEDNLKLGGKIVDYRRSVDIQFGATIVAGPVCIVDDRYVIESIRWVHADAYDAGSSLVVGVASPGVTAANSTAQHSSAINLAFTVNTPQTATITTQTTMNAGDRVCVKNVVNAANGAANGSVLSIVLKRVP